MRVQSVSMILVTLLDEELLKEIPVTTTDQGQTISEYLKNRVQNSFTLVNHQTGLLKLREHLRSRRLCFDTVFLSSNAVQHVMVYLRQTHSPLLNC